MTRTGSAMRTRRNASSACCFASSLDCPSSVKHSTICGSMRNTGFNAEPGSWYTIDASRARYRRSAASSITVTSEPPTRTCPPVIRPFDGR